MISTSWPSTIADTLSAWPSARSDFGSTAALANCAIKTARSATGHPSTSAWSATPTSSWRRGSASTSAEPCGTETEAAGIASGAIRHARSAGDPRNGAACPARAGTTTTTTFATATNALGPPTSRSLQVVSASPASTAANTVRRPSSAISALLDCTSIKDGATIVVRVPSRPTSAGTTTTSWAISATPASNPTPVNAHGAICIPARGATVTTFSTAPVQNRPTKMEAISPNSAIQTARKAPGYVEMAAGSASPVVLGVKNASPTRSALNAIMATN